MNKRPNTPRKNVLDGHLAKSFLHPLIRIVFNPTGFLATLLTKQIWCGHHLVIDEPTMIQLVLSYIVSLVL